MKSDQRCNVRIPASFLATRLPIPVWRDELNGMTNLALPVIGTYILEMLPGLVSIVLVGHIQDAQTEEFMDATALAVMFMNLTGTSIGFGMASAMDTLCSQAFGAKVTHKMGTYLQTGALILAVLVQGFFRGSGRQTLGARLNLVAFYCVGIPLGCLVAFWGNQGVLGLWIGITGGLLLIAVVGTAIIQKSDWELLAREAEDRIRQNGREK